MRSQFHRLPLLLLVLCLPNTTLGQSVYGTISGALTQKTGQPVSEALVIVSSLDRGALLKFSAQTDNSGYFIFSNLPLGAYSLKIQKDGFKTHQEPIVPVVADTPSEVDVKLSHGQPSEDEVGDGSAISILKLDRADVATSFNRHEIESLPILFQNVSRYELLVPGGVSTGSILSGQQNPQNGIYTSLSGQHFSGTEVILDGTVDRDPLQGIVVLNPSLDSVSELKITTQNYSAEFGPATGGVVSIQTRSGTSDLHGSVFGYRVSGFGQASVPNFAQSSFLLAATEKRNDFGASLGGSPISGRFFLFGDYRGIRRSPDGTVLLTVPTQTVHRTCTGNPFDPPCDLSAYTRAGAACTGPCANGMISNKLVSPQMVNFLRLVPLPNLPGASVTNNFIASGVDSFGNDNFDLRADYVISTNVRLFTRYSFADFRENGTPAFGRAQGGLGTNPSQFAGTMKDRNQGISAGFAWNLSSSLLTDFRFGFFRYHLGLDSLDIGTSPAQDAGVTGLNLGDLYSSGMPDIQLDNPKSLPIAGALDFMRIGYSPVANTCNCPLREREQQFQFVDNWTKLVGKHIVRWGGDFRYLQNFRLSSDKRRSGHLEFSNNITGFSLGDFLIGAVSFFDRAYNNPQNPEALKAGERQKRMFFYGEDTWRANSRFSVSYGLRWEIYLPQSVTAPNAGGWLQLGSGATPVLDQFLVAGQAGTNLQGATKTTLKNFGPRVGLAYLVNSTTVVRAGYGRMFDPGYGGTIFGIAATQSPPVALITTIQKGFSLNSNLDPVNANPVDFCTQSSYPPLPGVCTVPGFTFPNGPFTINDLYIDNLIASPNPKLIARQQQANLYALPRRLRLPTVDAWNLAVQEQLGRHTYLEMAYVANKGTHVLNDSTGGPNIQVPYYDLNQPTLDGYIGPTQSGGSNCVSGKAVQNDKYCKTIGPIRQAFNPWTGQVRYFGNDASNSYNSLQVKMRRQFSSGFSMLANYTWAKVIDFDNLYYAIDPRVSRGVGNFDRKHSFVMTNIWDLPVGRRRALLGTAGPVLDRLVGGWSLAAITSWSSGLPFTPSYSGCDADVGTSAFQVCRPNVVGTVQITGDRNQYFTTTGGQTLQAACAPNPKCHPPEQGFNTQTGQILPGQTIGPWQRPGAGQIGSAGRNSLRGPSFFQADVAVSKNISITERVSMKFRADAYNVFNNVNLGNPNPTVDSSSGGEISSLAVGALQRQIQFSLRVNF